MPGAVFVWGLLWLALTAQAAETLEYVPTRKADLISIPFGAFDAAAPAHTRPYRLILGLVPMVPSEIRQFGPGLVTPASFIAMDARADEPWPGGLRMKELANNNRTPLVPILRFESKGERLELKPRRRSIWIQWRKTFD